MGEDGADESACRARPMREVAAQHGDARELPILPGRTAFPSRPTENAEKTRSKRGRGGGNA